MEEFLSNLYSSSTTPVWSALLLGLMTAISPCPLATNITAMGFISKDLENRNSVFYNGIIYTVGRAVSYTLLAFVLYFGMLIPLTIQSSSGLVLPLVFAIATGIPVIIFAWLLAYTVSGVGKLYNRIKTFEIWFRRIVAVLFIGIGIYYSIIVWI